MESSTKTNANLLHHIYVREHGLGFQRDLWARLSVESRSAR